MLEKKYLEMLEYVKITQNLSQYAITSMGKEKCRSLMPQYDFEMVETQLSETDQAYRFIYQFGNPPISSIASIQMSLQRLESQQTLSTSELLSIANLLKVSRELLHYFNENSSEPDQYPALFSYFHSLYHNPSIEKEIFTKILDETTIDDKASSTLSSIRRKIRNLEQSIKETLHHLLHSSYAKYIQEPVITIRNHRYVIPVKEEYREYIKGFIHDVSSSGSTIFIEPISVFEMNNERNHWKIEENLEIERILMNLSTSLFPFISQLLHNLETIGQLDFIFAKAKYSKSMQATFPILNKKKQIDLKQARHPFIPLDKVVPISICLGKDFHTLVITGPNTGGKTVTLKTIGLTCLMAYSGLFIPASENSTLPVFSHVFVDIGDEQSIQESLSTFSSHMVNMIEILKEVDDHSLILLDELGSGTDPIEGSSLGLSILETLHKTGSLTISTTHYPEIKNYALVTDGFENASCEFDVEKLKPTYRLFIGIPGRSNAFAISKRLGLQQEILDRASSFMKQDEIHIEELLKSIYDDKVEIEKEKETIQKTEQQITLLRKKLEQDTSDLTKKKEKLIEDAKTEARNILLEAKEEVSRAIKEVHQIPDSIDATRKLNQIRNELNDSIKSTHSLFSIPNSDNIPKIEKGDFVFVTTLNQTGVVLSNPNKSNQVQVQVGSTKFILPISCLTVSQQAKTIPKTTSHTSLQNNVKSKTATTEINIIGCNVEEATFLVDKFLDDSSLAKLSNVRIVHGKGTGTLKNGIHAFLKNHPHVKSFRLGTFGEGEMGVTIVELK